MLRNGGGRGYSFEENRGGLEQTFQCVVQTGMFGQVQVGNDEFIIIYQSAFALETTQLLLDIFSYREN